MHLPTPSAAVLSLLLATAVAAKPVGPVTIPIAPPTREALAAAASAAGDSPEGCADKSFHSFEWLARSFDFHASYLFTTPSHQNSWGYVSFDLYNPADESTTHCEAASNQLTDFFYGTVAYDCDDAAAGRRGKTSFDFSRPSGRVNVNQTWACDDRDPQQPISFTGRGDVNLTLDCTETFYQNPNWTMGQIYSSREIKCAVIDEVEIIPFEMSAILNV